MRAEKFVKLTVDYDSIDIGSEWVAFNISRTLENTYTKTGITDKATWNTYLQDPFSTVPDNKTKIHDLILVDPEFLQYQPSFNKIMLDEDSENLFGQYQYNGFDYNIYKNNLHCNIYKHDYIAQKDSGKAPEFYYLTDLNDKVCYFEFTLYIPYSFIGETQENRIVFSTLHELLQSDNFDMVPIYKDMYNNKKQYLEGFLNAIYGIDEPYVGTENDFCAPQPEFMNEIGSLKFTIPGFTDFDEFFNLTKKYAPLDSFSICEKNFSSIMNLAILKTFYGDSVSEEFFQRFGEDYKLAQCIAMEYKLKPKNDNIKRPKI